MLYCPKCGKNYEYGHEECDECQLALVDCVPELPENEVQFEEEAFLISVGDITEANILSGKLNAEGIPVLFKYKGVSQVTQLYMNLSQEGIDIFVPLCLLTKAKELVGAEVLPDENLESLVDDEDGESTKGYGRKILNILAWVMILVIGFPVGIGLFRVIYSFVIEQMG